MPEPRTSEGASEIVAAFNALAVEQPEEDVAPVCPACGGDGWYIGHEDVCYDTGDCNCSGIQIQCECQADSGLVDGEIPF